MKQRTGGTVKDEILSERRTPSGPGHDGLRREGRVAKAYLGGLRRRYARAAWRNRFDCVPA